MKQKAGILGLTLASLVGCAGANGTYGPACATFEGQTIRLDRGHFVIDRFTDAVDVDNQGNVRDPFPGYPMRGNYRLDGNMLQMESDSGTQLPRYYLVESDGRKRLLTEEQHKAWTEGGSIDPCALTRGTGTGR